MRFIAMIMLVCVSFLFASIDDDVKLNELIAELKSEDVEQERIDDLIGYVESKYSNTQDQVEAYNRVIAKVGKYHLSKFGPKIRFYLSGPDKLEMFVLLKLKSQGLDNKTLKSILLAASGRYSKLGEESRKLLESRGFSKENIEIINNYEFLCSGGKLKLKDIVLMASSKVSNTDMADVIINSDMKPVQFNRENALFLESLGVPKEIVLLLVYRDLFVAGPLDYRVYDVLVDEKIKRLPHAQIDKKISSSSWYYKDFSELDEELLLRAGMSKKSIESMRKQTALFASGSAELTKNYENKIRDLETKREQVNFAKREEIIKQVVKSNVVFSGLANSTAQIAKGVDEELPREKSTTERIGGCVAKTGANFLCSKAPWPASLACSAVADNYLKCE